MKSTKFGIEKFTTKEKNENNDNNNIEFKKYILKKQIIIIG